MNEFVTISEAVVLTGRSISTIRRLAKRLASEGRYELVKKEDERYLISRVYLVEEFQLDSQTKPDVDTHVASQVDSHDALVNILREQIVKKDEQISQLLERQRETNILLHGYQQRLLPDNTPEPKPTLNLVPRPSRWWIWLLIGVAILVLLFLVLLLSGQLRFPLFTS